MKTTHTPSLAAFKSDAVELRNDFRNGCPEAIERIAAAGLRGPGAKLATCLRVIANEYGLKYEDIVSVDRMISTYAEHSYSAGHWVEPYQGAFRRARFLLQFDALVECLRDQVPLAVAADKRGVDFSGFHFSLLLFSRIDRVIDRLKLPDFSGLQAPGSLVHYHWLQDVTKLSRSNFSNAKFYTITADPLVQPGAYGWEADFSYADLRGADFRGAYLRRAQFVGAKVDGADFRNANINECMFTGCQGVYVSGNVKNRNWDVGPRGPVSDPFGSED